MKASIDVTDRNERDAVLRAWADPEVRAHVILSGILLGLADDPARHRVLRMIAILHEDRHGNGRLGRLHDGEPGSSAE